MIEQLVQDTLNIIRSLPQNIKRGFKNKLKEEKIFRDLIQVLLFVWFNLKKSFISAVAPTILFLVVFPPMTSIITPFHLIALFSIWAFSTAVLQSINIGQAVYKCYVSPSKNDWVKAKNRVANWLNTHVDADAELIEACYSADYEKALRAINRGANVNCIDTANAYHSPLHIIAKGAESAEKNANLPYVAIAELLLSKGANVNALTQFGGVTAFEIAIEKGAYLLFTLFKKYQKPFIDTNLVNQSLSDGNAPIFGLLNSKFLNGKDELKLKCIQELLKLGADPDAKGRCFFNEQSHAVGNFLNNNWYHCCETTPIGMMLFTLVCHNQDSLTVTGREFYLKAIAALIEAGAPPTPSIKVEYYYNHSNSILPREPSGPKRPILIFIQERLEEPSQNTPNLQERNELIEQLLTLLQETAIKRTTAFLMGEELKRRLEMKNIKRDGISTALKDAIAKAPNTYQYIDTQIYVKLLKAIKEDGDLLMTDKLKALRLLIEQLEEKDPNSILLKNEYEILYKDNIDNIRLAADKALTHYQNVDRRVFINLIKSIKEDTELSLEDKIKAFKTVASKMKAHYVGSAFLQIEFANLYREQACQALEKEKGKVKEEVVAFRKLCIQHCIETLLVKQNDLEDIEPEDKDCVIEAKNLLTNLASEWAGEGFSFQGKSIDTAAWLADFILKYSNHIRGAKGAKEQVTPKPVLHSFTKEQKEGSLQENAKAEIAEKLEDVPNVMSTPVTFKPYE